MKTFGKVTTAFILGVLLQGGIYYYLDQVYLAPTTEFSVVGGDEEKDSNFPDIKEGKKYYSASHQYMAVMTDTAIRIYKANDNTPINLNLKGHKPSYFEWMGDRDLALVGLYGGDNDDVVLSRVDPEAPDHEIDTTIEEVPVGSRITDVAYSPATNVVYMKVRVDEDAYRIYRTDANYDTRRVYMQASDIGRIAVFFDEDRFFYDNVKTGDVFMFNGIEGGWRVINPSGRYRLIGVNKDQEIYIVHVNADDEALEALKGKLGVGFETVYKYDKPTNLSSITVQSIDKDAASDSGQSKSDSSDSDSSDSEKSQ